MKFDIIIAGGGPAGIFAAIMAGIKDPDLSIAVLERDKTILQNLARSGGGKGNLTAIPEIPQKAAENYPRGNKELIGPFTRWQAEDTCNWFEKEGLDLVTMPDGSVAPASGKSKDLIDCLKGPLKRLNITLMTETSLSDFGSLSRGGFWLMTREGDTLESKVLLLATGGIRARHGIKLAEVAGHEVTSACPSLFWFKVRDLRTRNFSGLTLPDAKISIPKLQIETRGSLTVFAHALGGRAILNASALGARQMAERKHRFPFLIDWLPAWSHRKLHQTLKEVTEKYGRRTLEEFSPLPLPEALWLRLLEAVRLAPANTWNQVTQKNLDKLAFQIKASEFKSRGFSMNKSEYMTAGGVELEGIDFTTMESRIQPGIFFAGELLDIDGLPGGYNLQMAWTTGYLAARGMVQRVAKQNTRKSQ